MGTQLQPVVHNEHWLTNILFTMNTNLQPIVYSEHPLKCSSLWRTPTYNQYFKISTHL